MIKYCFILIFLIFIGCREDDYLKDYKFEIKNNEQSLNCIRENFVDLKSDLCKDSLTLYINYLISNIEKISGQDFLNQFLLGSDLNNSNLIKNSNSGKLRIMLDNCLKKENFTQSTCGIPSIFNFDNRNIGSVEIDWEIYYFYNIPKDDVLYTLNMLKKHFTPHSS
jgi:hypothetical protein